jgi:hypothetical protein
VGRGSTWLVRAALEQAHGDNADRGLVREILLTPIEKAPGGPAPASGPSAPDPVRSASKCWNVEADHASDSIASLAGWMAAPTLPRGTSLDLSGPSGETACSGSNTGTVRNLIVLVPIGRKPFGYSRELLLIFRQIS